MKLTVIFTALLTLGILQSCSQKEVLEASQNTPTLQAIEEGCPDEVANEWDWEVMPSTPPLPYDITLRAFGTVPDPSDYAPNGVVCECEEQEICIFFNYTHPSSPGHSLLVTFVNGSSITQIPIQADPQGGYIGYPTSPQLATALTQLYGQTVSMADLVLINHICIPINLSTGEVFVDVDFDGDEPADYDSEAIIKNVIGLCIVDNLGNGGNGHGNGGGT